MKEKAFILEFKSQWENETKNCAAKKTTTTGTIICSISSDTCSFSKNCFLLQVRKGIELNYAK